MGATQATFQPSTAADTPANPFGGYLALVNDADYGNIVAAPASVLNIKTGGQMPIATVAEIDRKIDDGVAGTGQFRIGITYAGVSATCFTGANLAATLTYNAAVDIKSCGGVAIQ